MLFLNEAVGTSFLGCECFLRHDLFFFGNTNMTVPDLQYDGTKEVLPSVCLGREDPTVFPHSVLGMLTSRYLTLAA